MFPPSIPLVLYATIASVSSTKSLLAGMAPGVVLSLCRYIWVMFTHKKHFTHEPIPRPAETESMSKLFIGAFPIMLAPVLILITMIMGVFSHGEPGAMAVVYMIPVSYTHLRPMATTMGAPTPSSTTKPIRRAAIKRGSPFHELLSQV